MITRTDGQYEARTRWNTHESGTAFDRKKFLYLTEQAQAFIAQQALCIVAGVGAQQDPYGCLVFGEPGFVQVIDQYTCLLPVASDEASWLMQGLQQAQAYECTARVGLFFISHATRERLCVEGTAEILVSSLSPCLPMSWRPDDRTYILVRVERSFFHCPKYIRTNIDGLTVAPAPSPWRLEELVQHRQITETLRVFLAQQVLCFLCTVNQSGYCAVNHRGGKRGFLVALPAHKTAVGGEVLLPDYEGNGAFEAIGNILETERAAIVVPDYSAQLALCLSGLARVVEIEELSTELQRCCIGARRVIRLLVQRVTGQAGDWSAPLAYERDRAWLHRLSSSRSMSVCPT
ncbi:MAG: pyridoxamine 5'-phosphate oxidase family protein [Chloroflexi bacterium]|nr:pyridoxamine 5'-phosphate oxidase family protein [Chloroflexota bacterium]